MPNNTLISRVCWLILIAVFTGCVSLLEAREMYAPALNAGDNELGLALVNPTLEVAAVTLTARSYDGTLLEGLGITNPATLSLGASSQKALRAADVFGPGISGRAGWVELTVSAAAVEGSFFFGSARPAELPHAPASHVILPNVSASSMSRVTLINTAPQPVHASISLYGIDGQFAGAWGTILPALSGISGTIKEIAPESADFAKGFEGYAVVKTAGDQQAPESLVGIEAYPYPNGATIVPGLTGSSPMRAGHFAHFISDDEYSSRLTLINVSDTTQGLLVMASGTQGNGNSPVRETVEVILDPGARLEKSLAEMFQLSASQLKTGYIHFETTTDTPGVFAYVEYVTTDGAVASAVEAQDGGNSNLYLPYVVEGSSSYAGLALVNPNDEPSLVTLDLFEDSGNRIASAVVNLGAGERKAGRLNEFFRSAIGQIRSYLRVTATRPIFAQQLSAPSNSRTFLASAAAGGSRMEPQLNGRTIDPAKGAKVISADAVTSLLVAPNAIDSEIAISVTTIRPEDSPPPVPGQRVIAAVTGLPSGARFRIPARLSFPLNAKLQPGTRVPLSILDPDTGSYESTEFVAIVDESGRMASAEVTHFTTFVAAISEAQFLSISSITPSEGLPDATVMIAGDGFSTNPFENVVTFAGANNTSVSAEITAATATSLQVVVPDTAVTGSVFVTVGELTSNGLTFTEPSGNPTPTDISISPKVATAKTQSLQVRISGIGFMPTSLVYYDGSMYESAFVDSTLMFIDLANHFMKVGVHKIQVVNPPPGGGSSTSVEFTVTGSLENQAPVVYAGSNATIMFPNSADLAGTATDDGLPANSLSTTWSKYSGPGDVTFGDPSALATTAVFSREGTYVLRLLASDAKLWATSDVTIYVQGVPNAAPVVYAGVNQTITLPATATLNGTATDDGLPAGSALTTTWSKVSGPGTVTFASVNTLSTTVSFSTAGSYILRLTVSDTALSTSSDVSITVSAEAATNNPPVVSSGSDQTITLPDSATLSGSISDDGLPTGGAVTATWSKVSGPGPVTFGNVNAASTVASFTTVGTYVLRLTAADGALSSIDDVTVTVNPCGVVVSGTVTVTANASDNVGVVGVAITLDGAPMGNELTTAPYSIPWNTLSASNGCHTLRAVARDAAGNQGTASSLVTVSNP